MDMEQWYRQNKVLIPWTLLGLEIAISVGLRLYKIRTGIDQDTQVVPSPAKTLLPKISEEEAANLPYPPDAYKGKRDVESVYGSLRVYEWGPEGGRKVLLVHGITNPSVALGAIAHGLVDRGCRVILFDLPGRGYSSTPLPTPHSVRLFTTSILLALTSSPISWTGNGTSFSLVGYSLGGGIAANFTSYFPTIVSSLVLLAPGGLIREDKISFTNKLLYNTGLINETTLESIIKRKLKRGDPPTKAKAVSADAPVAGELPKEKLGAVPSAPVLSRARPGITFSKIVVSTCSNVFKSQKLINQIKSQAWQIDAHQGFVKSFMSSIRYGPITNQHSDWQRIGKRLSAQNASSEERYQIEGLQNGKVLILCGKTDALINSEELLPDATGALGANNVRFEFFDAGHELAVTKSAQIVDCVWAFWQGK